MLKRAIIDQYHKINPEHLQDYVNEIAFKYNNRDNNTFTVILKRMLVKQMPLSSQSLFRGIYKSPLNRNFRSKTPNKVFYIMILRKKGNSIELPFFCKLNLNLFCYF